MVAKFLHMSASAEAAAALQRMNLEIDVRHVLPTVRAPTLLIHAKDDRAVPVGASRQMAEAIPNATLVEIDSSDHLPFYDKPDEIIGHIQTFLTGGTTPDLSESRVATLMFTDIVGSTDIKGFISAARQLGHEVSDDEAFLEEQQKRVFEWAKSL